LILKDRINQLLESLNTGLIEREEIMDLTFLSAIAGESIFLLGPPGVAKSLIARRLKFAFKDAKSFEYLMHRFSTPDEVFGPISVSKLKTDDKLERVTDFYLPGANVAFLDEIWKAGPSIQNTLLTILNEKIYRNGEQEINVDLFGIISASNELPEENQGLDALWDRFLFRYNVECIKDRDNFEKMIKDTNDLYIDNLSDEQKISKKEYKNWETKIGKVVIPQEVLDLIHHIRIKIKEYNEELPEGEKLLYVSDRRWKKIIKTLKTSAFLNGRKKVDLMDCFLIPHMIWDTPEQIENIFRMVKDCIHHQGYSLVINLKNLEETINELKTEVENETSYGVDKKVPKLFARKAYKIIGLKYPYIKKSVFNKLKIGENSEIDTYYEEDCNTPESGYVIKRDDVTFEVSGTLYKLELKTKKSNEPYTRPPLEIVIKNWNKRINDIKANIGNQIKKIVNYEKTDLKDIKNNLFVDASKSEVVLNKIEDLRVKLDQLAYNCDELRHSYTSIEDEVYD